MKLYHGTSCRDIKQFDLNKGRKNIDFGKGVYFTSSFQQALEWSCRHSSNGAVYECELDLSAFSGLNFSAEDEDVYYYVYLCRLDLEDIVPDAIDNTEGLDYVQGVMLDGKIRGFEQIAEKFNEGDITIDEFKQAVEFWENKNQVCIKSEQAIAAVNASILKVYFTVKTPKEVEVESERIL